MVRESEQTFLTVFAILFAEEMKILRAEGVGREKTMRDFCWEQTFFAVFAILFTGKLLKCLMKMLKLKRLSKQPRHNKKKRGY